MIVGAEQHTATSKAFANPLGASPPVQFLQKVVLGVYSACYEHATTCRDETKGALMQLSYFRTTGRVRPIISRKIGACIGPIRGTFLRFGSVRNVLCPILGVSPCAEPQHPRMRRHVPWTANPSIKGDGSLESFEERPAAGWVRCL